MRNKYCALESLHNEADVEAIFINRLLEDFNYSDDAIKRKDSLSNLVVGSMRGMPQGEYRSDYAIGILDAFKPPK